MVVSHGSEACPAARDTTTGPTSRSSAGTSSPVVASSACEIGTAVFAAAIAGGARASTEAVRVPRQPLSCSPRSRTVVRSPPAGTQETREDSARSRSAAPLEPFSGRPTWTSTATAVLPALQQDSRSAGTRTRPRSSPRASRSRPTATHYVVHPAAQLDLRLPQPEHHARRGGGGHLQRTRWSMPSWPTKARRPSSARRPTPTAGAWYQPRPGDRRCRLGRDLHRLQGHEGRRSAQQRFDRTSRESRGGEAGLRRLRDRSDPRAACSAS